MVLMLVVMHAEALCVTMVSTRCSQLALQRGKQLFQGHKQGWHHLHQRLMFSQSINYTFSALWLGVSKGSCIFVLQASLS